MTEIKFKKIGLFGGTFDPIHFGHLISASSLAERLSLDKVIFIPANLPPHKLNADISSSKHRYEMLKLAIEDNKLFDIDTIELNKTQPCYTIDTVKYFHSKYSDEKLFLLIGADSLAELPSWYQFDKLIELIEIITAYRGGFEIQSVLEKLQAQVNKEQYNKLKNGLVRTPMIEISASEIRSRIKQGKSIKYLVPHVVEDYILKNKLYR